MFLLEILVEDVLGVVMSVLPTGMDLFSGACPVDFRTMQIGWGERMLLSDRFFSGKLLKNEPCVNRLIVALSSAISIGLQLQAPSFILGTID